MTQTTGVRLDHLVRVRKGTKPAAIREVPEEDDRRALNIADLRPGAVTVYRPPAPRDVVATPNDIVLAWDGANAGTSAWGLDGVAGSTLAVLSLQHPSHVVPAYLGYFLRANETHLRSTAKGATVPHIDPRELGSLEVRIPSLSDQRRISALLDEAAALAVKQSDALRLPEEAANAAYREMFSDRGVATARLSDIAEVSSGITKGRKLNGASTREVPYMAVANVQDKRLDLRTVKTIAATDQEIARYTLRSGDLLLTEGGDPDKLGRGVLWNDELPESIHQNHVFRVRLKSDEVDPVYLNWHVGSPYGKSYFLRMAKQTTGIASINSSQLKAFPVKIPRREEQKRFAESIREIEHLRAAIRRSHEELEALFAAMQHRAFRGEV